MPNIYIHTRTIHRYTEIQRYRDTEIPTCSIPRCACVRTLYTRPGQNHSCIRGGYTQTKTQVARRTHKPRHHLQIAPPPPPPKTNKWDTSTSRALRLNHVGIDSQRQMLRRRKAAGTPTQSQHKTFQKDKKQKKDEENTSMKNTATVLVVCTSAILEKKKLKSAHDTICGMT